MQIAKLKVGEIYIDGKNHPVYKTGWLKKTKEGKPYFEFVETLFVQTIEKKEKEVKTEDFKFE